MSKNTTKLEKECIEWKSKWQKCNISLIELATEKKDRDEFSAKCGRQVDQLQKLLRALQHERTVLYNTLKENNINSPQIPPLPEEPELMKTTVPPNVDASKTKMEMMAKNCAELKLSLATLHDEMKQISNKQSQIATTNGEAPAAPVENKKKNKNKNKNKKNKTCPRNSASPAPVEEVTTTTPDDQNELQTNMPAEAANNQETAAIVDSTPTVES